MDNIRTWNGWNIEKELGEGAFGKVYQISREDDFGNIYTAALKVMSIPKESGEYNALLDSGLSEKSATEYFDSVAEDIVREAVILSKVKGAANIVGYEDNQYIKNENGIGGTIFIRMELLTPFLKYAREHIMDRGQIIKLGIDICKALEACHSVNIIHRDIKPENIFVSKFGEFKLGDFGIARTMEGTSSEMSKKGTFTYMAPEVYKGESYNATVDIYSLGLVLYKYLNNGKIPFLPADNDTITYRMLEEAREKRLAGEDLPKPIDAQDELGEVILKACNYRSEERYQSATDFRAELERLSGQDHTVHVFNNKTESQKKLDVEDFSGFQEEKTTGAFSDPVNGKKKDVINRKGQNNENKTTVNGINPVIILGAGVALACLAAGIFLFGRNKNPGTPPIDRTMETATETSNPKNTEVKEEAVPDWLKEYVAPSALADDPREPEVKIDGKVYRIPCPVNEFTDDGWTLSDEDPSGRDIVLSKKDTLLYINLGKKSDVGLLDDVLSDEVSKKDFNINQYAVRELYIEEDKGKEHTKKGDVVFSGNIDFHTFDIKTFDAFSEYPEYEMDEQYHDQFNVAFDSGTISYRYIYMFPDDGAGGGYRTVSLENYNWNADIPQEEDTESEPEKNTEDSSSEESPGSSGESNNKSSNSTDSVDEESIEDDEEIDDEFLDDESIEDEDYSGGDDDSGDYESVESDNQDSFEE